MKSTMRHDKVFRHYESAFDRKAAKHSQIELRRKREHAMTLNTNESDDYSDISDIWEESDQEDTE